jgi:hypothetical protein
LIVDLFSTDYGLVALARRLFPWDWLGVSMRSPARKFANPRDPSPQTVRAGGDLTVRAEHH